MRFILVKIFTIIVSAIDKFFNFFLKKFLFRGYVYQDLRETFKTIDIEGHKIKVFIPSNLAEWRASNLEEKEPETIEWINNFELDKNIESIFWDIGANIGLYSLYAAKSHGKNLKIISFEPSVLNLNILARNISVNNFENEILINQIPITNKKNSFLFMKETFLEEGASLSTYGEDYNFEGKKFNSKMKYKIFGTSLDYYIENKILDIPKYIKIDVDGIEHLILETSLKALKTDLVKSILVEVNENFEDQKNRIENIMHKCNFSLKKKCRSKNLGKIKELSNTFNYIYFKNDK